MGQAQWWMEMDNWCTMGALLLVLCFWIRSPVLEGNISGKYHSSQCMFNLLSVQWVFYFNWQLLIWSHAITVHNIFSIFFIFWFDYRIHTLFVVVKLPIETYCAFAVFIYPCSSALLYWHVSVLSNVCLQQYKWRNQGKYVAGPYLTHCDLVTPHGEWDRFLVLNWVEFHWECSRYRFLKWVAKRTCKIASTSLRDQVI